MSNVVVRGQEVSLMEVLDRVLEKGVVLSGDITISVADVDLIFLGLRAILSSVETMEQARATPVQCGMRNVEFGIPQSAIRNPQCA